MNKKDESESHGYSNYVEVKRLKNNWVSGFYGTYRFRAKVYDKASKYGINDGRVRRLKIWGTIDTDQEAGLNIRSNDPNEVTIVSVILSCLELLPVEASDEVS